MAARIDPRHVRARHQSMHHLVANAPGRTAISASRATWSWRRWSGMVRVAAWLVDDTGFPKKGQHSVGWPLSIGRVGQAGELSGGRDRHVGERWPRVCRRRISCTFRRVGRRDRKRDGGRQDSQERDLPPQGADRVEQHPRAAGRGRGPGARGRRAGYGVSTEFRDALTAHHFVFLGVRETTKVWPPGVSRGRGAAASFVGRPTEPPQGPSVQPAVRHGTLPALPARAVDGDLA